MSRRFSVFTLLAVVTFTGCDTPNRVAEQTDRVDGPSDISGLVGHWKSELNDHLYFGEIDPKTRIGAFTLVQGSRPNQPFTHRYEFLEGSSQGLKVRVIFESDGEEIREFKIEDRGKRLTQTYSMPEIDETVSVAYSRVDDLVAPAD